MHGPATVSADNLPEPSVLPQRRQQLTSRGCERASEIAHARYVTADSDSGHCPIDEPPDHNEIGQPRLPFTVLHIELETEAAPLIRVSRPPRCRARYEGGHVRGVCFVGIRESAGDIRPLPLHSRSVDENKKRD